MYNPALLITSLFAASILASPLASAEPAPLTDLETRAPPAQFKLKTKVIDGKNDTGTKKGNLWVYSYHTGAGLGDAALSPNKAIGNVAHINASTSELLFTIGDLVYPMEFDYEEYAAWSTVEISVAASNPAIGFFINSAGLHNNGSASPGWIACDWWHGVPQLFWTEETIKKVFPTSCSTVSLTVVAV